MKTKVKEIAEKTYQGKVTGHSVTLENGVTGYLNDKGSDTVSVGSEVDYTLEVKKNKQGKDYNLLTLKLVSETPQKGSEPETKSMPTKVTTSTSSLKAQASVKAMEFLINAFIADKVAWNEIQPKFKELAGYLNDAIDECSNS